MINIFCCNGSEHRAFGFGVGRDIDFAGLLYCCEQVYLVKKHPTYIKLLLASKPLHPPVGRESLGSILLNLMRHATREMRYANLAGAGTNNSFFDVTWIVF